MKTIDIPMLLALTLAGAASRGAAQPVITQQPRNQTNVAGTTAIFSVVTTGTPPLSYQWRSYANPTTFTNIPSAIEATLTLTNVQPTPRRLGVVVTDGGVLSVTSSLATLTVFLPPSIIAQPSLLPVPQSVVVVGGRALFSMVATGTPPLRYQWRFNDADLPGSTNSLLSLTNVAFEQGGNYSVEVTNAYGRVASQATSLQVIPDPFTRITNGPVAIDLGLGRGGAWGDYDGDGFIDLVVTSGGSGTSTRQRLYHNNRDGTFLNVSNSPIAMSVGQAAASSWGDYDNDGNLDLVVIYVDQTNHLFRNEGNGVFTKANVPQIVSDIGSSRAVTWVDYDNDGYLDLFRTMVGLSVNRNRLYRNERNGTFSQVTQGSIVTDSSAAQTGALGAAWGDYNNDGRSDLFVAMAHSPRSRLYRNDGNGIFTRTDDSRFDPRGSDPTWNNGDWGDYDNDGDLDLFVASESGENTNGAPNVLLRNDGPAGFTSITNLPASDPEFQGGASWGAKWADYDNDGWLDLFVANMNPAHNNFLYHNNGDGTFTKITGGSAVETHYPCRAIAWGDYDNDGFPDLFIATGLLYSSDVAYPCLLLRNNGSSNHWCKFRLIGTRSNRSAYGAKVRVHATIQGKTFWQLREIADMGGYLGQNDMRPNFGLGDATNIDLVRIEWPSGTVQELRNIAANQILTITEPGGEPTLAATKSSENVTLTLTGKQGSPYEIEQATTLGDWLGGVLTVTPTNAEGVITFPAPASPQVPAQFFRARLR